MLLIVGIWLLTIPTAASSDTLRLSLDECIMTARRQSVDAAVALGELKSAYWAWRSYKADLLPEVSLSGTLPSYNKRYSTYQREDGTLSYVRNDYLELDGTLHVSQRICPTGSTLSIESSLDWLRQLHAKRRTEECGVRRAFGATPRRVLFEFLLQNALLATVAVIIGCIIYLNYAYSGYDVYESGFEHCEKLYTNVGSTCPPTSAGPTTSGPTSS